MTSRRFRCLSLIVVSTAVAGDFAAGAVVKVPLIVQEPTGVARTEWPVTSGIPFVKGALAASDPVHLGEAESGKLLPLQTRITCKWPDGSVKWLLIDSRLSLAAQETKRLVLESGAGGLKPSAQAVSGSVSASKDEAGLVISTGPLRASITPGANLPGPIQLDLNGDGKWADDEKIASRPWMLILETPDGHRYSSDVLPANVTIEETGAIRTAIRIDGQLADAERNPRFRYLVRLHFYAGKPFVRAFVTLIVDVPDQVMVDIRSFKLVVPTGGPAAYRLAFGGESPQGDAVHQANEGGEHRLFQVDDRAYRVDGKEAGRRAAGWASWADSRFSVGVGVRDFWQQWPKAISAGKDGLTIELIPSFDRGLYDGQKPADESKWTYALRDGKTRIKIGAAKTHELWIEYGKPEPASGEAASLFRQAFEPLLATCEPGYICATKALGDFPPADPANPDRFMGYDRVISQAFKDHLADREKTREYGLLNFGDWWGERGYNWGNLEYDMQRGLIAQYARTGKREYYLRAEEAARHHIDVDVVHAVNPQLKNYAGPPPVVGNVWVHATGHTGGYFPDGAFKLEQPYTVGYSLNLGHVWDRGDLDYYFLSGDERAREVGLQIAETLRRDAAPHFKIGTHMRDIGWPMLALMAAYRATGETKYLDAVRHGWEVLKQNEDPQGGWIVKLAKGHCLHEPTQCKGNVDFIMGIVISALCDYHRETGDPEVAKTIVRAVDFTLRETYVPEKKMFRYTSCPLTPTTPSRISFLSESLTYAWQLSGDEKYLRILHEATQVFHESLSRSGMGKGFSMHLIFSPEGLWGLDRQTP